MNGISAVQMLAWFGMLLTVVLCATVLWRTLVRTRRVPKEASCDSCGYPVQGLDGWLCPECGSDLRVVGVTTAQLELRRRGGVPTAWLAWTILMIVVGIVGWTLAADWSRRASARAVAAAPTVTQRVEQHVYHPRGGPSPQGRRQITLDAAHTVGLGEEANAEVTVVAQWMGPVNRQRLTIAPDGSFRWIDRDGAEATTGEQPTLEIVADFLRAANSPPEASEAEAQELFAAIEAARRPTQGPLVAGGGGALVRSGVSVRQATTQLPVDTSFYETVPRVAALAMVAGWVVGLVLIPVRRRRMIRRAGGGVAEPRREAEAVATA